jgi:hypothetical protein
MLGAHVLKAFFTQNAKWQSKTLSCSLNLMTLKLAELESMREGREFAEKNARLLASEVLG